MTGSLLVLLAVILVLAIICTVVRKRAVRWLFTILAVLFWIGFLALLGFVIGYRVGDSGFHVLHLIF